MSIVSGNHQSGLIETVLPARLFARVVDAFGAPRAGVRVEWTGLNPLALTLLETTSVSDANGEGSARVQLANLVGTFAVSLRSGDQAVSFHVHALSRTVRLRKVSGDPQPPQCVNSAFLPPLVVEALNENDRPVGGLLVSWSVTGPAWVSANAAVTGQDGRAQVSVFAEGSPGNILMKASAAGLEPVVFSLEARLPGLHVQPENFSNYPTAERRLAPGSLAVLTAAGIARNVPGATMGSETIFAGELPLGLAGLEVEFRWESGAARAPIYWIARDGSDERALIQVPFEVPPGEADVLVRIDREMALVKALPIAPVSPGSLERRFRDGRIAMAERSDGSPVSPLAPARPGEVIRPYAIGLGQTAPRASPNRVGMPEQRTLLPVIVGIDHSGIEVLEAKIADNLIGIYQVAFRIPEVVQTGFRPLALGVSTAEGSVHYAQASVIPVGRDDQTQAMSGMCSSGP